MGHEPFGRQAALDQPLGRRACTRLPGHARRRTSAAASRSPGTGPADIEALAFIGADLVHGLAAARADRAFRRDRLDDARQVLRQRAAIGPPLGGALAALGGVAYLLRLRSLQRLADILK